ncbi:MAG: hypothetical protein IAG10_25405, partial [Planctomycetaceae bacterium]|nr:hypothetical protein [Planctomycetaceae bacterium]
MFQESARWFVRVCVCLSWLLPSDVVGGEAKFASHSPLRTVPTAPMRVMPTGPTRFVDSAKGDDAQDGSRERPWRTVAHALRQLSAGDTLLLRGGVFRENVSISLAGRRDAPITIASFPGEQAILDGGLAEFFDAPSDAWQPFDAGGPGEFRSTRRFPNIRNVVGSFGDSLVGLHTYYHAKDLRAKDEHIEQEADMSDIKPMYCGPGLWYDRASGYLHARLAHTHLAGFDNYRGETDPRRLPLVIAPFRSVPLHLDRAEHLRIQDLVIRGGGFDTVRIDQSSDIEFDNVTIWCGTYGVRAKGAQRLRLMGRGFYGNSPPWATRYDAGLNSYPGRTQRDLTRYNTHAWLVPEANGEHDVYSFPFNDDWEIAYCEFGDAGADGVYLGGVNARFHHNLVENTTDDGLYLSPMYARLDRLIGTATLHIHQNVFRRALTMFAYGGAEKQTTDKIFFYRNIVDLREPVRVGRPSTPGGSVTPYFGKLTGDHGSPPWPTMFSYHNTFIAREPSRYSDMGSSHGATADRPRRVFNNIFVHEKLPPFSVAATGDVQSDG